MTYLDRLQSVITLTAPDGQEFVASWASNKRSFERKVGIFNRPDVEGSTVQDLGSAASVYPVQIMFSGLDHDINGSSFFTACGQKGLWSVQHPVKGKLSLQLVKVTEVIDPTLSGNITRFDTEWVQPIPEADNPITLAQQVYNVSNRIDQLDDTAASQFSNVNLETAQQNYAVVETISRAMDYVQDTLSVLYKPLSDLNTEISSIRTGLIDGLTATVLDAAGLAGQIQHLIRLPALATTDLSVRFSAYAKLLEELYTFSADENDPLLSITDPLVIKNKALTQELLVTSVFSGLAATAVYGELTTRATVVSLIDSITDMFTEGTAELDKSQSVLLDYDIAKQYFTQSESFADSYTAIETAIAYLLSASFDLAIEKRFTLTRQRAPIEIVISEYGSLGKDDAYFDEFIAANVLSGYEILILPAGREVVTYGR